MKTVNPVIIAKDENGKTNKYSLMTKQTMPSDAEIKSVQHNNFCTTRLNTLMRESDINKTNPENKFLTITPRFCNMNYDPKTKKTRKFYEGDKGNNKEREKEKEAFGGAEAFGGDKKKKNDSEDEEDDDDEKNTADKNKKSKDSEADEDADAEDKEKGKGKKGEKTAKGKKNKNKKGEDADASEADDADAADEDDADAADKGKGKGKEGKEKAASEAARAEKAKAEKANEAAKVAKPIKENPIPMDSAEIGIPELMKLYYDVYDEKKKEYTSMSPEMRNIYQKDVDTFYRTFTGKEVETDENGNKRISTFEQIPLNEYHKSEGCKPDGVYTTTYEGSLNRTDLNENLFEKYASHVNKMMNTMNSNQDNLMGILKQLFIFKKKEVVKEVVEEEEEKEAEKEEKAEKEKEKEKEAAEKEKEKAKEAKEAKEATAEKEKAETTREAIPVIYQGPNNAPAPAPVAPAAVSVPVPVPVPVAVAPVTAAPVTAAQEQAAQKPAAVQEPTAPVTAAAEQKGGEEKEEQDVIINPELDESLLQALINSARQLIVKLYVTCETDFVEGLHIFEAIVATQLGRNVNSQIKLLDELTLEYLANKTTEE